VYISFVDKDPIYTYINAFFLKQCMNEIRDAPIDPTMVKRQRTDDTPTVINMGGMVGSKPSIKINVVTSSNEPTKQQIARQKSRANIVEIRFRRSMKTNDSNMLLRCLEAGYKPSTVQWLQIIGKMHVATALNCVRNARNLDPPCVASAIRRQHRALFKEVLSRVDKVPRNQIESLMAVPAYYLDVCLKKGLDPNIPLKNKRLPLEHACSHSRIAHIEILLQDERTVVSQNVCRFMIRQPKQQKYAERAIELCKDIVPSMILEAVVANVTTALCSIMKKLESKYGTNEHWDEIIHMMMCPILSDFTTDIVKTPLNDHYYDRQSLLQWVRTKGNDPLTREELRESDLLIRSEFLKEYATSLQSKIKKLT